MKRHYIYYIIYKNKNNKYNYIDNISMYIRGYGGNKKVGAIKHLPFNLFKHTALT